MEYNDYKLISDNESKSINQGLSSIRALEIQDLQEIYHSMQEQCNKMKIHNENHKYDKLIDITTSNLNTIKGLLESNTRVARAMARHNTDVYGKVPSHDEMMRMNAINNTPLQNELNDISPNTTTPISPQPNVDNNYLSSGRPDINPPTTNRTDNSTTNPSQPITRSNRRAFPLQSSILANITKSLFLKKDKSSVIKQNSPCYDDWDYSKHKDCNDCIRCDKDDCTYQNNPHNNHHDDRCDHNKKIVTGQIDLLRLMILFLSLRPKCPYQSRICQVIDSQFGVLLNLI